MITKRVRVMVWATADGELTSSTLKARVDGEATRSEGVPRGVIRTILTKGDSCACRVMLRFAQEAK